MANKSKPKTRRITITLDSKTYQVLKVMAKARGITIPKLIVSILEEYVREHK